MLRLTGSRRPGDALLRQALNDGARVARVGGRELEWTPRYCESVKTITVSVSDDVFRRARIRAAEQGTSVSALVAAFLGSLSDQEAEFAPLEVQQRRIQGEIRRFSARNRLSRDDLQDRTVR